MLERTTLEYVYTVYINMPQIAGNSGESPTKVRFMQEMQETLVEVASTKMQFHLVPRPIRLDPQHGPG